MTVLLELAPIASEDPLDLEREEVGESGQNKNIWVKYFINNANTWKFDFSSVQLSTKLVYCLAIKFRSHTILVSNEIHCFFLSEDFCYFQKHATFPRAARSKNTKRFIEQSFVAFKPFVLGEIRTTIVYPYVRGFLHVVFFVTKFECWIFTPPKSCVGYVLQFFNFSKRFLGQLICQASVRAETKYCGRKPEIVRRMYLASLCILMREICKICALIGRRES